VKPVVESPWTGCSEPAEASIQADRRCHRGRNDMAHRILLIALGTIVAASPVSASIQEPDEPKVAPAGTPDTLYCMRIEAIVGSRLEEVKCWTRQEWAENEVDIDKDWAEEGVAIISGGVRRPVEG
jgi:hypothetical protein